MLKLYSKTTIQGFSLVEISIILVIIAMLTGSSLSIFLYSNDQTKQIQTLKKMEVIEQAIIAFVKINNRLPCPGDISLGKNDLNSGIEKCNCNLGADLTSNLPAGFNCPISNFALGGTIPVKTLNLPQSFMEDGWGSYIIYYMTKGMGGDINCADVGPADPAYNLHECNMGLIKILDQTGNLKTDKAAISLFSSGKNRLGGWDAISAIRSTSPPLTHINERRNYDFLLATMVQQEHSEDFDDIVMYKTKEQLMHKADFYISNENCEHSQKILNNVTNFYCGSNPNDALCSKYMFLFATKVSDLCN